MTMSMRDACPECRSPQFKRKGHIHNGKQHHRCKACGRQFVVDATHRLIDQEHRLVGERLLCEKISLHGICRAIGVSIRWLMEFMVTRFAAAPEHLHVPPGAASHNVMIACLAVEADAWWSFVQKKVNPHWVWIAMDRQRRQIIAFHVGDRSRESAKPLWANIPAGYREQATFYPDHYAAYLGVIPAAQPNPLAKLARNTNHIERFNNTLRQRVSQLVRSTWAFSKSGENHIGAIRYFICHYHLTKAALLV